MKNVLLSLVTLLAAVPAFAEEAAVKASVAAGDSAFYALGAGFAMAVAALGGALAQGRIAGSAMEGISRNPQAQKNMFVSMILGLVFVETLVLFTFVVANGITGKF